MAHSPRSPAILVLCMAWAMPACSAHEDGAHDGDASVEGSHGDVCQEGPVWDSTSLSFSLSRMPSYFTTDVRTYEFSLAGRTLTRQGCRTTSHVDRSLSLGDGALQSVLAAVGALRSTCEARCGTDSPVLTLTIHAGNGGHAYVPDQLCLGPPPYLPVQAMNAFEAALDEVLDAANTAMDGGVDAAARCPVLGAGD